MKPSSLLPTAVPADVKLSNLLPTNADRLPKQDSLLSDVRDEVRDDEIESVLNAAVRLPRFNCPYLRSVRAILGAYMPY